MRVNRLKLGAASLLLMAACTGFPFFGRKSPSSPCREARKDTRDTNAKVPPRTVMEFQDIQYDGWTLSARLLVGPEGGPLRLDRRLVPWSDVEITRVSDCKYGSVMSMHADVFAGLACQEDLLVLNPGYWYGRTVHFGLFDEHFTGLGPECVEADIILLSFDGKRVARQRIRAERPPVPAAPDGGIPRIGDVPLIDWDELERLASPDAGTP
jgi:hypothetical protein